MSEKKTISIGVEATPRQIAMFALSLVMMIFGLDQLKATWAGTPAGVTKAVEGTESSLGAKIDRLSLAVELATDMAVNNKREIGSLRAELLQRIEVAQDSQEKVMRQIGKNLQGFLEPLVTNKPGVEPPSDK